MKIGHNVNVNSVDYLRNSSIKEFTGVKYTSSDLKDGLLSVIVMAKNKTTLNEVKQQILSLHPENKLKCEYKIIKGFAVSVNPSSNWVNKNRDIDICLDGTVKIPNDTFKERDNKKNNRLNIAMPSLEMDKVWAKGFTGKGVTIAILDTGIHPHPDFAGRIVGFKDFVNQKTEPYDDQGHGTHCSGDAAGNGTVSNGLYKGSAPEASLVGVKLFDKNGDCKDSDLIKGVEWVVENKDKYGIRVISMSWGDKPLVSWLKDPLALAVDTAFKRGIITVASAGNSGPKAETVKTPAFTPSCIAVAAVDDENTLKTDDDNIPFFSARGPSPIDGLKKPDIATPGVDIMAASTTNDYRSGTGTSMACPIMAGIIACLIQASPSIGGEALKKVLFETARKIKGENEYSQGAGVPNANMVLDRILTRKE